MTTTQLTALLHAGLRTGERVLLRDLAHRIELASGISASRVFAKLLELVGDRRALERAGLVVTEDRPKFPNSPKIRYLSVVSAGGDRGEVVDCTLHKGVPAAAQTTRGRGPRGISS